MYECVAKGIVDVITGMFILLCITVPLGIWKLIDIIIWLCHHVNVVVN